MEMSNRYWFFASLGQQQGPCPEAQFRDFIAAGTVRADTLVWTEGMSNWQKAGEIPGLMSQGEGPPVPRGMAASTGTVGDGSLSIDFGIWDFTWRSLLFLLGAIFVIPLPWALVMYCRWIVSCAHVPARPNLTFTGKAITVMWWYLGAIILLAALSLTDVRLFDTVSVLVQLGLYWLAIKWVVANLASNGKPLGLSFSGSFWAYLGWNLLAALSLITIIGWAWVYTAQIRWVCRRIEGTRRELVFKATGLQYLWRAVVVALACCFIIPIPWALRWIMRWHASQIVLVERFSHPAA
jgi:heme/copper-type cytochrome/quinol oxidase subunit 2